MPVFPSQDLYGKKICETYQQILQIFSGSVLNGAGSQQQFLNVTASYVIHAQTGSGTPIYTGSSYPITSSWSNNSYTSLTSITASYAYNFGNSITQSFFTSSTWVFDHNLGQKEVIIQVYDQNDYWIVPQSINLFDENTSIIQFSLPRTGVAIATRGGVRVVTGSNGTSGTSGISGTSGTSGQSGTSGTSGTNGTSGQTGSSGTSGSSGSSGSSGTSGGSLSGGATDMITKWIGPSTIGNSVIFESSSKIGINGTSPAPADYLVVCSPVATNATVYITSQRRVGSVNAGFKYSTYGASTETIHWINYVQASDTNNTLRWYNGSADTTYLNAAGDLGLNTLPSNKLHINNTVTGPAIRIDGSNTTTSPTSLGGRTFHGWLPISLSGSTYYIPLYLP